MLWAEATFSLDASALLNFYEYRSDTRKELFEALQKLAGDNRLWMSYQALVEFEQRRIKVIQRENSYLMNLAEMLTKISDDFEKALKKKEHWELAVEKWKAIAKKAQDDAEALMPEVQRAKFNPYKDVVWDRLRDVVGESLGQPLTPSDEEIQRQKALARFAEGIPPGYMDATKADGGVGDYLIWKELLDHAHATQRPIVFITDDKKEDWWQIEGAKASWTEPRPELINEMHRLANQTYYQYTVDRFLNLAGEKLGIKVSEAALDDVRSVEEHRSRYVDSYGRILWKKIFDDQIAEEVANPGVVTSWAIRQMSGPEVIGQLHEQQLRDIMRRAARIEFGHLLE